MSTKRDYKVTSLLTAKQVQDRVKALGADTFIKEFVYGARGSGKTTGTCLGIISKAILAPDTEVYICKHKHPDLATLYSAQDLVAALDLRNMEVKLLDNSWYLIFKGTQTIAIGEPTNEPK